MESKELKSLLKFLVIFAILAVLIFKFGIEPSGCYSNYQNQRALNQKIKLIEDFEKKNLMSEEEASQKKAEIAKSPDFNPNFKESPLLNKIDDTLGWKPIPKSKD